MKLRTAFVLAMVCASVPAHALNGPLGLGVVVGEPTGLTAKYWLDASRVTAVDVTTAWSLSGDNEFQLHGDYLFHNYTLLRDALNVRKGKLPVYVGIGGRVKFREHKDDKVGIRLPVGVSYIFDGTPVDVFAEVVPVVNVAPDTEMDVMGGVGVRFYF